MSIHENRPSGTDDNADEGMFFTGTPTGRTASRHSASEPDPAHPFDDAGFSQPSYGNSGATTVIPAPVAGDPEYFDDAFEAERRAVRWHGGADFGLLVLRLVVGGAFVGHGLQHVFGLLHGMGHAGFAHLLATSGYQNYSIMAWVAGGTELAGGALLVLGLFTPVAAAGLIGVMSQVITLKVRANAGFFAPTGFELELVLAAAAFALLFAGPGRVALDRPTPWFRHPVLTGWIFLVVSAGASAGVWFAVR